MPLTIPKQNKRVVILTDAATVTLNVDVTDVGKLATLSQTTTFANPTGTPVDGQQVMLRIKSTASRAVSFGTSFRGSTDLPLPSATTGSSKTDYFGFQYNADDSKYDIIASNKGF
jgi:hypothetical protein